MTRAAALVASMVILAACAQGSTSTTTTAPSETTTTSATTTSSMPTSTTTTTTTQTTSTAALAPVESVADQITGTVGFVGCSMSQNSVEGYEAVGGSNMWTFRLPYGGGTIGRWNDGLGGRGDYWGGFDKGLELDPDTTAIWWNLCTIKGSPQDSFENAVHILDEIRTRIPDARVFVSAQPTYSEGHVCGLAGEGGPELMVQLSAALVEAGLVEQGPTMGPLSQPQTRDGCHANEDGQRLLGQQLLDFFG